jgi:hypothetical protein
MGFIPIQECIETKQLHQRGVSEQFREEMKNKAAWGWRRKEKRPSSSSMVNHRLAGREIIKTSFYSSSSSLLFSHRFFFLLFSLLFDLPLSCFGGRGFFIALTVEERRRE